MKHYISLLLLLLLFLTACSETKNLTSEPVDKIDKDNNLITRKFFTDGSNTKFVIHNDGKLSKDAINNITKQINDSYIYITNNYKNKNYDWNKKIDVYIKTEIGESLAMTNHIVLYNTRGNNFNLTHEMAHTLLGIGNQDMNGFNYEYGLFTQEGLATVIEEELYPEKFVYPNNGVETHKVMKYILDSNQNIPLYKLIHNEISEQYFRSSDSKTMWISYIESGSFMKYLIEIYSKEKVMEIYNTPNFQNDFIEVFGCSIEDIEKEWIKFILNDVPPLTSNEKGSLLFP